MFRPILFALAIAALVLAASTPSMAAPNTLPKFLEKEKALPGTEKYNFNVGGDYGYQKGFVFVRKAWLEKYAPAMGTVLIRSWTIPLDAKNHEPNFCWRCMKKGPWPAISDNFPHDLMMNLEPEATGYDYYYSYPVPATAIKGNHGLEFSVEVLSKDNYGTNIPGSIRGHRGKNAYMCQTANGGQYFHFPLPGSDTNYQVKGNEPPVFHNHKLMTDDKRIYDDDRSVMIDGKKTVVNLHDIASANEPDYTNARQALGSLLAAAAQDHTYNMSMTPAMNDKGEYVLKAPVDIAQRNANLELAGEIAAAVGKGNERLIRPLKLEPIRKSEVPRSLNEFDANPRFHRGD